MTVYSSSVKVHTSIYWYILVHTGASEYLFSCSIPCCTRLARLKAADLLQPKDTLFKLQQVYSFTTSVAFSGGSAAGCRGWRGGAAAAAAAAATAARRRRRRRRRRCQVVAVNRDSMATLSGKTNL